MIYGFLGDWLPELENDVILRMVREAFLTEVVVALYAQRSLPFNRVLEAEIAPDTVVQMTALIDGGSRMISDGEGHHLLEYFSLQFLGHKLVDLCFDLQFGALESIVSDVLLVDWLFSWLRLDRNWSDHRFLDNLLDSLHNWLWLLLNLHINHCLKRCP